MGAITFFLYLNIFAMVFGLGCGLLEFKQRLAYREDNAFIKSLGLSCAYMMSSMVIINAIRIVIALMF